MATENLKVKITADASQAKAEIGKFKSSLKDVATQGTSATAAIGKLTVAMGGLLIAVKAVKKAISTTLEVAATGDAIKDNASAIVFSAIDYTANAAAIDEAIRAGIPVIVIDSDVDCEEVACRIMTDNYEAGRLAGQEALDNNPGKLVIGVVNYDINSANGQQREQGFCDVIEESGRECEIYTINCLSTEEAAYDGTRKLLEEHPDINTIAALNELMSLGSGYAIRDMDLIGSVDIYAFDSNVVSVGMLETGEIKGLVVQNPYAMGYLGVENAYKLINGMVLDSDRIDTTTTYVCKSNMYDIDIQRMIFRFEE